MILYDISMGLKENMQVYKNRVENRLELTHVRTFASDGIYETRACFNLHTGTHIDMPLHTIEGGADTSALLTERIFGVKAKVIDLTDSGEKIMPEHLYSENIEPGDFLLFKTHNSYSEEFLNDFTYISANAASFLCERRLSLRDIPAGEYTMYALPLKLEGTEAAPARVIIGR